VLDEVLDKVRRILREHPLCDACLGRLFGLMGYGLSNRDRGRALKTLLLMTAYNPRDGVVDGDLLVSLCESGFEPAIRLAEKEGINYCPVTCYLCGGLVSRVGEIAERSLRKALEYEFSTFQVGCHLPDEIVRREEELWTRYGLTLPESLRNELTREIGKVFQEMSGKEYSTDPELVIIYDAERDEVEVQPKPLFIYGRYRKLVRGLPQNPWPYRDERIKYDTSIEELITAPILRATGGTSAKFHGAGREDIDVRTLGNGRPFIVEVRAPRRRRVDLAALEKTINEGSRGLIEVYGLRFTDREHVSKIKALAELARKTYRALVRFEGRVSDKELRSLEETFRNLVVKQRTPTRVLHRRPDKVRNKVVYSLRARRLDGDLVEFVIECQGGLYVKELIHGDGGRTTPNISELIGKRPVSIELDVIGVEEVL